MSDMEGASPCPTPKKTSRMSLLTGGLLAFLLAVIAFNEAQRTMAQERAHRERQDLAVTVAELNRKVDWLLLTQPSTPSALALRPQPSGASRP